MNGKHFHSFKPNLSLRPVELHIIDRKQKKAEPGIFVFVEALVYALEQQGRIRVHHPRRAVVRRAP
jgi:hypothetical protein